LPNLLISIFTEVNLKRLALYIYVVIATQNGCNKAPTADVHETLQTLSEVRAERLDYLRLTRASLDPDTFITMADGSHCDSLLFTSLYMAAGGEGVDLERAKGTDGLWYRHPRRDCASTISKDMYIGLFTYLWHQRGLGEVAGLIKTAEARNWVMGDGPAGEVIMTPNLAATLYELRYRLGGADGLGRRLYNEQAEGRNLTGYQAHLQVLHTLLRGSLMGGVTALQLNILRSHAERQPRNVLFLAAYHRFTDGDQAEALRLWPSFCPAGHLPTTAERCDDYLWQRDEAPSDWQACPKAPAPELTYTGVDCEVAAALLEGVLD
jgi:hypothetical protein